MIKRFCKKHSLQIYTSLELFIIFILTCLSPIKIMPFVHLEQFSRTVLIVWEIIILIIIGVSVFLINYHEKLKACKGHSMLVKIPHTKHDYNIMSDKQIHSKIIKKSLPPVWLWTFANLITVGASWFLSYYLLMLIANLGLCVAGIAFLYNFCVKDMHTKDIAFKNRKVIVSTYGDKHPSILRITFSDLDKQAKKQRRQEQKQSK